MTLWPATLRAMPATNPVRPLRAPLDRPRTSIGAFTAADVMLTMRPNLRAIMPSTVALMSSIGVSMLASMRAHPRVAIPVAEVARRRAAGVVDQDVRAAGHAASAAARPSGVVMSHATHATLRPAVAPISSAARCDVGFGAREDRHVHAFARQRFRAAASQSLAGRADQRAAAGDAEIHGVPPRRLRDERRRSRARTADHGADREHEQHGDDVEHLRGRARGRA